MLGTENPADLMTKNLARQSLDKCMLQVNQHRTLGGAEASLDIQGKGKTSVSTDSCPGAEFVFTGRISRNSETFQPDVCSESEATDAEMPALVPLALPAEQSARNALIRLNAKRKFKPQVAPNRDTATTSRR